MKSTFDGLVEAMRQRFVGAATSPFAHAPYPLRSTMDYEGDPGLFGPGSVSWSIIGDVSAFVGGIRGLLIQAAHPEVVAGVADHSRYREDPLGRLSRTSAYVTATTYGAIPEVEEAVQRVRHAHKPVHGTSSRGVAYNAEAAPLAAWVHNALTDSFLQAHRVYGGSRLHPSQADRFVTEQSAVGRLLDAAPIPTSERELSEWIATHPDLGPTEAMVAAVEFLTDPPLEPAIRIGYSLLLQAAIVTIPERIRAILGVSPAPLAEQAGRGAVAAMRWALGYSPSWELALRRCGAEIPEGLFRQPSRVA